MKMKPLLLLDVITCSIWLNPKTISTKEKPIIPFNVYLNNVLILFILNPFVCLSSSPLLHYIISSTMSTISLCYLYLLFSRCLILYLTRHALPDFKQQDQYIGRRKKRCPIFQSQAKRG